MALTQVDGGDGLKKPADFADNEKARFGTGNDLEIYHDGTDTFLKNVQGDLIAQTVSPGDDVILRAHDDVIIQTGGSDNAIICNNDADVSLYYNTNKKLETTNAGILVNDNVDFSSSTGRIRWPEHSNTASRTWDLIGEQGAYGRLELKYGGADGATPDEISWRANANGAVELYYDGNKKLSTKSDGIDVTGEVQCDSLDVDGNAHFSGGADTTVTLEGTNDVLLHLKADTDDNGENGNPEIKFTQDGTQHVLSVGVNGETGNQFTGAVSNNGYIHIADGHVGTCGLDLATNNTRRLTLNSAGHLFPASDNTYDLGKSNAKFRNVYSENFAGSGGLQSVQVFTANGTWTKPSGVTKVRVTVTGGGGGGGAGTQSWNTGQGGGAGGTAIEVIDVSSVSSVSVTVGSGGAGATGHTQNSGSANGSNGGTSSFGSYCSATGGSGGDEGWGDFQDLGNGGSGSGGNINLNGGDAVSKGGGNADDQATASLGGASYWGGGGKGGGRGNDGLGDANNGQAYGSGGGGGAAGDGSYHDGHQGKGGIVYVEEFA